jgi:hypothetical protein
MIETLLDAALRSIALAALVWLCLRLPRLRNPHIQLTAWTIVLAASLLMPATTRLAAVLIPPAPVAAPTIEDVFAFPPEEPSARRVDVVAPPQPMEIDSEEPTRRAASPVLRPRREVIPSVLFAISVLYVGVTSAFLIRMATGLLLTLRLVRGATRLRDSRTLGRDIRVSEGLSAPATFGATILLPPDYVEWSETKLSAVLAHESAHAARGDFYIQIAAMLNRAIFWFNPLSWWLQRRLAQLAEAVSDDAALARVKDRPRYAEILLELSRTTPIEFGAVAMARPATVRARIERILAESASPLAISKRARVVLLAAILPLAGVAASPLAARSAGSPSQNEASVVNAIRERSVFGALYPTSNFVPATEARERKPTAASSENPVEGLAQATSETAPTVPAPDAAPKEATALPGGEGQEPAKAEAPGSNMTSAPGDDRRIVQTAKEAKIAGGSHDDRRALADEAALARFAAMAPFLRQGVKARAAGRVETQVGGKSDHVSDGKGEGLSADVSLAPPHVVADATPDVCDRAPISFTDWNTGDPTGQRAFARCRERQPRNSAPTVAATQDAADFCKWFRLQNYAPTNDPSEQRAFLICQTQAGRKADVSPNGQTQTGDQQSTIDQPPSAAQARSGLPPICFDRRFIAGDPSGQHAFYLCHHRQTAGQEASAAKIAAAWEGTWTGYFDQRVFPQ